LKGLADHDRQPSVDLGPTEVGSKVRAVCAPQVFLEAALSDAHDIRDDYVLTLAQEPGGHNKVPSFDGRETVGSDRVGAGGMEGGVHELRPVAVAHPPEVIAEAAE